MTIVIISPHGENGFFLQNFKLWWVVFTACSFTYCKKIPFHHSDCNLYSDNLVHATIVYLPITRRFFSRLFSYFTNLKYQCCLINVCGQIFICSKDRPHPSKISTPFNLIWALLSLLCWAILLANSKLFA